MKRLFIVMLALLLCFGAAASEEELIGSWQIDFAYMAEKGLITEEDLFLNEHEVTLIAFSPDGTWMSYYGMRYDYTLDGEHLTINYADPIFIILNPDEPPAKTVYSILFSDDNLIARVEDEDNGCIILRRISGENGLVGRWAIQAYLTEDEYASYADGEPLPDDFQAVEGYYDFFDDGSCVMLVNILELGLMYAFDSPTELIPRYTTDGEHLTLTMDDETVTMDYAFENGYLMLKITDTEVLEQGEPDTIYLKKYK